MYPFTQLQRKKLFLQRANIAHAELSFSSHKSIKMVNNYTLKTFKTFIQHHKIAGFHNLFILSELKRRKHKCSNYQKLTSFFNCKSTQEQTNILHISRTKQKLKMLPLMFSGTSKGAHSK